MNKRYIYYLALFFAFLTFSSDLIALLLLKKASELQANPYLLMAPPELQTINAKISLLQKVSLLGAVGFVISYGYWRVRVKTDSL